MIRRLTLGWMLASALVLSGCGGSSSSTPAPTAAISQTAPSASSFSIEDGNVTVNLSGANSTTERDANLSYQWSLLEKPTRSSATMLNSKQETAQFIADVPGDYTVSLIVNDGADNSEAARLTLTATTSVPLAIADAQHSVSLGTASIGLDGSKSALPTDATGDLSYLWQMANKPSDSSAYLDNADQAEATLHLDIEGEYLIDFSVSYDGKQSQVKRITVVVSSGNAKPVAKANNITVTLGQKATLDASSSVDPEGESLQYRWHWSRSDATPDGVPEPALSDLTQPTVSFTPIAAGEYQLTLFVFDGQWKSDDATVTVTVEADPSATTNQPPVGEIKATGYYPSYSIGEQEVGLRAEFLFDGYDPEGKPLQIISATLLEKPEGSSATLVDIGSWKPLGKKIKKGELDKVGNYKVQFVVSDGEQTVTKTADLEAKIGNVNGYPFTRGIDAQANSVLVGEALIFDASSKDPNSDPITFHWELVDKPNGSNATIEAMIEPESGEYRRAQVVTDVAGSYTARLIVEDDRGLYSTSYAYDSGFAKLENTAPEIRSVVWARSWSRMKPGEDYFQILPCMALLHRPVVVDADGDDVATHEELISTPEGGEFTSYPDSADCPDSRGQVFSKAGQYTFRYYASDGIDDAENYDFVVNVDPIEDAKGVRLRSINSDNESLWRPVPYEYIPPFATDFYASSKPFENEASIQWSLIAADGDYTIENVVVRHINGGLKQYTPRFEGLEEGTTIAQGEDLKFKTIIPPVTCIRNEEKSEGFHFSFRIKELPEITFVYEDWRTANTHSDYNEWPECEAP